MKTPWWKHAVIYQIYPRSFRDTRGDGVGDLDGIRSQLDHIVELGVDAVWLSPIFPSPMADHGYDVADYCDVDPLFGSLETFDAILTACGWPEAGLMFQLVQQGLYLDETEFRRWANLRPSTA